mmetsp:Transcript_598/g.1639  ORF Transcript_598/g.1639 Transcript_598/m.1639 type:complete len:227 (-) Transcript_598:46-726(-)
MSTSSSRLTHRAATSRTPCSTSRRSRTPTRSRMSWRAPLTRSFHRGSSGTRSMTSLASRASTSMSSGPRTERAVLGRALERPCSCEAGVLRRPPGACRRGKQAPIKWGGRWTCAHRPQGNSALHVERAAGRLVAALSSAAFQPLAVTDYGLGRMGGAQSTRTCLQLARPFLQLARPCLHRHGLACNRHGLACRRHGKAVLVAGTVPLSAFLLHLGDEADLSLDSDD